MLNDTVRSERRIRRTIRIEAKEHCVDMGSIATTPDHHDPVIGQHDACNGLVVLAKAQRGHQHFAVVAERGVHRAGLGVRAQGEDRQNCEGSVSHDVDG